MGSSQRMGRHSREAGGSSTRGCSGAAAPLAFTHHRPSPHSPPPAGAHTRSIMVTTPSAASGGIMKFAQKRLTCLGCKAPLGSAETTVCKHCKEKVRQAGVGRVGLG